MKSSESKLKNNYFKKYSRLKSLHAHDDISITIVVLNAHVRIEIGSNTSISSFYFIFQNIVFKILVHMNR